MCFQWNLCNQPLSLTPRVMDYWLICGTKMPMIQVLWILANWFRISISRYNPCMNYHSQNNRNCFWSIYCKFEVLHGHWAFCLIYSVKGHQSTQTRGRAGNKTRTPQTTANVLDSGSFVNRCDSAFFYGAQCYSKTTWGKLYRLHTSKINK